MVFQIYGNIMSCDMIKIFKRKKYNKVQYEKLFYFVYLMALQNVKKKLPLARDLRLGEN